MLVLVTMTMLTKEVGMSTLRLPSINRVVITGRLTHEPQFQYTPNGTAVLKMRIASNRSYKDSQGEWRQEVTFLSVVVWNKLAENCSTYLSKGSAVSVEGRLKSQQWEDAEGNIRTSLEVHAETVQFLDKASSDSEGGKERDEEEGEQTDDDKGLF
jgi:single-strand DNA-binding protein